MNIIAIFCIFFLVLRHYEFGYNIFALKIWIRGIPLYPSPLLANNECNGIGKKMDSHSVQLWVNCLRFPQISTIIDKFQTPRVLILKQGLAKAYYLLYLKNFRLKLSGKGF